MCRHIKMKIGVLPWQSRKLGRIDTSIDSVKVCTYLLTFMKMVVGETEEEFTFTQGYRD